jgi:hypothetical protein
MWRGHYSGDHAAHEMVTSKHSGSDQLLSYGNTARQRAAGEYGPSGRCGSKFAGGDALWVRQTGSSVSDTRQELRRCSQHTARRPGRFNLARYNIDGSSGASPVNTTDLLRLVQLLNGAQATQVFNGATVAACP